VKLKEWSYEHGESGGWVYPDYPDEIIQKFIEYFRITKREERLRRTTCARQ
jgi:hypothetical protein